MPKFYDLFNKESGLESAARMLSTTDKDGNVIPALGRYVTLADSITEDLARRGFDPSNPCNDLDVIKNYKDLVQGIYDSVTGNPSFNSTNPNQSNLLINIQKVYEDNLRIFREKDTARIEDVNQLLVDMGD